MAAVLNPVDEYYSDNFIAGPEFDLLKRQSLPEFLVGYGQVRNQNYSQSCA